MKTQHCDECKHATMRALPEQERPSFAEWTSDHVRDNLHKLKPEQEQLDAIPDAFNEWWNADYDDTGNPYRKDSPAYWAWSGWKAASKQPEQEPMAHTTGHCENHKQKGGCQLHNLQCGWPDCDRKPITTPPAQQEPEAAECKFDREQKWIRCEIAHHNLVQSEPHKWPGYQTRLLYTSPPAQRTWVDPNDKTQKQYLPHIGEPVLFCHKGAIYTGKHTGGSFQSEVTNQYFNTWECHWMYLPAAHGIKGEA